MTIPTIIPINWHILESTPIKFQSFPKHSGAVTKYVVVTAVINAAGIAEIFQFLLFLFKYTEIVHRQIMARVWFAQEKYLQKAL